MALALSLVTFGLVLFGSQLRLLIPATHPSRLVVPPVVTEAAARKPPVRRVRPHPADPAPAPKIPPVQANGNAHGELLFEEHLSTQAEQNHWISGSYAIRAKVESAPPSAAAAVVEPTRVAAPGAERPPMIALVIDDLGDHPVFAKNLTELPFPVTMAVLPNRPRTRYAADLAAEHGLDVILHQPMQPSTYPRINPGPGAVFTDMDDQRVIRQVSENLAQLPNVVGMNNHMGSAFTEDAQGMAAVMSVLKAKGLFFLDSVTSAKSSAPAVARQAGVPLYRRSVFLDNVRNVRAILGQLKNTERVALKNGRAIAIGHPYSETMEALKLWAGERDGRIRLVRITELGPE